MHEKNLALVEEAFKKYYFDHFDQIHVPPRTSEREFGYQKFNLGMKRHLAIKNDQDLHLLLMTQIPSDVYCSNGYYSFPNLPMAEKDWKEADLIFDLDAKDLNLPCRKDHTCIKCNNCQNTSIYQTTCPNCASTKIEIKSVTCQNCISGLKKEVKKLLTILKEDFGINNEDIQVFFSGNEGFHVHAVNSQYQTLTRERTELIDYIMFKGAIPESFGFTKQNFSKTSFPESNEKGWGGRVSKAIFNSKAKRTKAIQQILQGGYSVFNSKLEKLQNTIGIKIDPNVTTDIHRIFRLGGSINSKSGLSKILCKDFVDDFDPYLEACFIDDEETQVLANCPVQFKLKNKKYGPYTNEKISVPKYAAIYMICKGLADAS